MRRAVSAFVAGAAKAAAVKRAETMAKERMLIDKWIVEVKG